MLLEPCPVSLVPWHVGNRESGGRGTAGMRTCTAGHGGDGGWPPRYCPQGWRVPALQRALDRCSSSASPGAQQSPPAVRPVLFRAPIITLDLSPPDVSPRSAQCLSP